MDEPDYKFNEMLQQSLVNVENLSGKVDEYLQLVGEFARAGDYSSEQVLALSNTAQVLSNISDLKPDESVSALISSMTAFNIEAEKSIMIADKLNEVNKYQPPYTAMYM